MNNEERIALWFSTGGSESTDQEARELLNDAADEIARLREALKQIATPLKFVNEDLLGDPYYYRKLALDALKEVTDE